MPSPRAALENPSGYEYCCMFKPELEEISCQVFLSYCLGRMVKARCFESLYKPGYNQQPGCKFIRTGDQETSHLKGGGVRSQCLCLFRNMTVPQTPKKTSLGGSFIKHQPLAERAGPDSTSFCKLLFPVRNGDVSSKCFSAIT